MLFLFYAKSINIEGTMAEQPILNETTPTIGEIHLNGYYRNLYISNENEPVDEPHIHSCYEIYVNLSGDVSFLHNSEIYDIQKGDVIISHPSDVHHCMYHSPCIHEHFCVWFTNETIGEFLMQRNIRGKIRPSSERKERLIQLLDAFCSSGAESFLKAAYLIESIALLDGEKSPESSKKGSDRMNSVLSYIDKHLTEIKGINEVAQAFFISDSTLNRMFRSRLGMSFGKYLEAQKLAFAERLLRADSSVTDACFLAGFTDCSRFIAKFKEKFGVTPLKYKKSL